MKFHPSDPRDARFKEELDGIAPNLSADLSHIVTLSEQESEHVLEAILSRGCQGQHVRNILLGREAINEIPREWLVARVEKVAERALNLEDDWEFRRLLELYSELDPALLKGLVARGLTSKDADIREAAEDFRDHGNLA